MMKSVLFVAILVIMTWAILRAVSVQSPCWPCTVNGFGLDLIQTPIDEGYLIEVAMPQRIEDLAAYKISMTQNGTSWDGFPKILSVGILGRGPSSEYLNFTDLTGDGNLTGGDRFTLEKTRPGTLYELKVMWALSDHDVASVIIDTGYVPPTPEEEPILEQPWFWIGVAVISMVVTAFVSALLSKGGKD